MKVLTVAVPLYNTQDYIRRCLDSLVSSEVLEDLEIVVVNDGSKDNSSAISHEYEKRFPGTVRVIDKENGGHGSAVNAGLAAASGKYFRVIDSDDWVNTPDFIRLVHLLKDETSDLVLTDYRKENVATGEDIPLGYKDLEDGAIYDFGSMDLDILDGEYFVMASSTYRTQLLRDAGVSLFEKIFYVDMQFNLQPIPSLKNFRYYSLDIYRYFIGRPDQSMDLANFVKKRANHEMVLRSLVDFYADALPRLTENSRKYIEIALNYMIYTHYCIYILYNKDPSPSVMKELKSFDSYLSTRAPSLYQISNKYGKIRIHRKSHFFFLVHFPRFSQRFTNAITRG